MEPDEPLLPEAGGRTLEDSEPSLPESPEAILATLGDDPEGDLDRVTRARIRWPDDEGLALAGASALQAMGRIGEAEALLRGHVQRVPNSLRVAHRLGNVLLERGRRDQVRPLARSLLEDSTDPKAHSIGRVLLAEAASKDGKPDEAKGYLKSVLQADPDDFNAMLKLAAIERDTGERETAMARLDEAVKKFPKPGPHDWDRMVVGTLLDRWDAVRDSAARLGFDLPGEGQVDDTGALCRVRFVEDGEIWEAMAERSGPVTAWVLSIAPLGRPQHIGDEVVFSADPLNPGPKPGEEHRHTWLFPVIAVKRPGNQHVFALDGSHPGEEALDALRNALGPLQARLAVQSYDSYRVRSPDGEMLKGIYALVSVPQQTPLAQVDTVLRTQARSWRHPLFWSGLLEMLGNQEELARHRELMDRYGIKG